MASGGRDLDWSLIAGRECGQIGTEPKNGSKVGDWRPLAFDGSKGYKGAKTMSVAFAKIGDAVACVAGGSDGATMRFEPESADGANAGLGIERDILQPVKRAVPEASTADIWTLAGAQAVEVCGGPKINHARGVLTKCEFFLKTHRCAPFTFVSVAESTL